jgi:hypothetical protein
MNTVEKPKSKKQQKIEEQQEAAERLIKLFQGDDKPTVYTILRHRSKSGMSRNISLKYVKGGQLMDITYSAAIVLGWPIVEEFNRAIKVNGCGMDMGFHLVSSLSSALFSARESDGSSKLRHEWA